jgi:hypothetical protein
VDQDLAAGVRGQRSHLSSEASSKMTLWWALAGRCEGSGSRSIYSSASYSGTFRRPLLLLGPDVTTFFAPAVAFLSCGASAALFTALFSLRAGPSHFAVAAALLRPVLPTFSPLLLLSAVTSRAFAPPFSGTLGGMESPRSSRLEPRVSLP